MEVALSLRGILVGLGGGVLLYVFHDPSFGDNLQLTTANPGRDRVGARVGLGLVVLGASLQFAAVLAAT